MRMVVAADDQMERCSRSDYYVLEYPVSTRRANEHRHKSAQWNIGNGQIRTELLKLGLGCEPSRPIHPLPSAVNEWVPAPHLLA